LIFATHKPKGNEHLFSDISLIALPFSGEYENEVHDETNQKQLLIDESVEG